MPLIQCHVWEKVCNSDVLMIFLFCACNTIDVTVADFFPNKPKRKGTRIQDPTF